MSACRNSLGYCEAAVEVHFFGVTVEPSVITADTSSALSRVRHLTFNNDFQYRVALLPCLNDRL
jgi:hypothetical protein